MISQAGCTGDKRALAWFAVRLMETGPLRGSWLTMADEALGRSLVQRLYEVAVDVRGLWRIDDLNVPGSELVGSRAAVERLAQQIDRFAPEPILAEFLSNPDGFWASEEDVSTTQYLEWKAWVQGDKLCTGVTRQGTRCRATVNRRGRLRPSDFVDGVSNRCSHHQACRDDIAAN
jgi:hypothetical protein